MEFKNHSVVAKPFDIITVTVVAWRALCKLEMWSRDSSLNSILMIVVLLGAVIYLAQGINTSRLAEMSKDASRQQNRLIENDAHQKRKAMVEKLHDGSRMKEAEQAHSLERDQIAKKYQDQSAHREMTHTDFVILAKSHTRQKNNLTASAKHRFDMQSSQSLVAAEAGLQVATNVVAAATTTAENTANIEMAKASGAKKAASEASHAIMADVQRQQAENQKISESWAAADALNGGA